MIVMIIICGFAAMTIAMWMLRKYVEERIEIQRRFTLGKVNELEILVIDVEYQFDRREEDDHPVNLLTGHTRRDFTVD